MKGFTFDHFAFSVVGSFALSDVVAHDWLMVAFEVPCALFFLLFIFSKRTQ